MKLALRNKCIHVIWRRGEEEGEEMIKTKMAEKHCAKCK
jgi:hypothetical protein